MSETTTAATTPAANAGGAPPPASQSTALAPVTAPTPRIPVQFDPNDPIALYMDTGVFEQLQRVAKLMATSGLVPEHLRNQAKVGDRPAIDRTADCFLVVAQAFRWRMDPFAVSQHTFVLKGKLGYEGKLIAAVINASGKTEENLKFVYTGDKGTPGRTITVIAKIRGEKDERTVEGTLGQWATDNDQWKPAKGQQDQMLAYRGAREWARRHMPEVMLGIHAEEEVAQIVQLQPTGKNTFGPPKTLDDLAERLSSETPETVAAETTSTSPTRNLADPATCEHKSIPPSRLAQLPITKSLTCVDCGTDLQGEMEREPGADDDDPSPLEAVKAVAAAAAPEAVRGRKPAAAPTQSRLTD